MRTDSDSDPDAGKDPLKFIIKYCAQSHWSVRAEEIKDVILQHPELKDYNVSVALVSVYDFGRIDCFSVFVIKDEGEERILLFDRETGVGACPGPEKWCDPREVHIKFAIRKLFPPKPSMTELDRMKRLEEKEARRKAVQPEDEEAESRSLLMRSMSHGHRIGGHWRVLRQTDDGNIAKYDSKSVIEREYQILTTLWNAGAHMVPRPLSLEVHKDRALMVMSRIPGQSLKKVIRHMSPEAVDNLVKDLQAASIEIDKCTRSLWDGKEDYVGYCVDPRDKEFVSTKDESGLEIMPLSTVIDELASLFPSDTKKAKSRALLKMICRSPDDLRFCHLKLLPDNIIVNDGKFSGIVDWNTSGRWPERLMWMSAMLTGYAAYTDAIVRVHGFEDADLNAFDCLYDLSMMFNLGMVNRRKNEQRVMAQGGKTKLKKGMKKAKKTKDPAEHAGEAANDGNGSGEVSNETGPPSVTTHPDIVQGMAELAV